MHRVLQGSEKGNARIGLALITPPSSARASLLNRVSHEREWRPARLNDIAFYGSLPAFVVNKTRINNRKLALAHTHHPESALRWYAGLPNSCSRPIDAHDLILVRFSPAIPTTPCEAQSPFLWLSSHRAASEGQPLT